MAVGLSVASKTVLPQYWALPLTLAFSVLIHGVFLLNQSSSELELAVGSSSQARSFSLNSFKARPRPQPTPTPQVKPLQNKLLQQAAKPKKRKNPVLQKPKRIKPKPAHEQTQTITARPFTPPKATLPEVEAVDVEQVEEVSDLVAMELDAGIPVTREARFSVPPPTPRYPKLALKRRQSGEVLVRVLVSASGKIDSTKVVRSSGFKLLDQAALHSVQQWQFEPWKIKGIAHKSWVEVPVDFNIRRR